MKMLPEEKLITMDEIIAYLAEKHDVEFTDGMATG